VTSDFIKERFPIGSRVSTNSSRLVLKGQTVRLGTVIGYCKGIGSDDYVRVNWDSHKLRHSGVTVDAKHLVPDFLKVTS